jgi:hypothetical protein
MGSVVEWRDGLKFLPHGFDLLQAAAVEIARTDNPEPAGPDLRVRHQRQTANVVPAQPLHLERVHPHLGCRERTVGVVLVDRLGNRLEILRLGGSHAL